MRTIGNILWLVLGYAISGVLLFIPPRRHRRRPRFGLNLRGGPAFSVA